MLQKFVDPRQILGPEKVIPQQILRNAQVLKFLIASAYYYSKTEKK